MSKTYAVTGWRVGIDDRPRADHAFRQVHDYVTIGAAAPLQEAGAGPYRCPDAYYRALADHTAARRDFLVGPVEVGFDRHLPQGAYYVMADVGDLIRETASRTKRELARHLVRKSRWPPFPGAPSTGPPRRRRNPGRDNPGDWANPSCASASASGRRPWPWPSIDSRASAVPRTRARYRHEGTPRTVRRL